MIDWFTDKFTTRLPAWGLGNIKQKCARDLTGIHYWKICASCIRWVDSQLFSCLRLSKLTQLTTSPIFRLFPSSRVISLNLTFPYFTLLSVDDMVSLHWNQTMAAILRNGPVDSFTAYSSKAVELIDIKGVPTTWKARWQLKKIRLYVPYTSYTGRIWHRVNF